MPTAAGRVNLSRVAFNPSGLTANYSHNYRAVEQVWVDASGAAL